MSRLGITCLLLISALSGPVGGGELTPATRQAFDRYVELFEAQWRRDLHSPHTWSSTLRNGQLRIVSRKTLDGGVEIKPPLGMIQDWLGAMFLPQSTLAQVRAIMQDYPHYKDYFKPEVIDSKIISYDGHEFEVFLRLYKKQVVTAVLNTNYSIQYGEAGPATMYIVSHSKRISEVSDPGVSMTREYPPGNDVLWALNSYWRFEQAEGGVYAECEAISLSRDVPFGLGWAIKGFLDKFPKDSMQNTLEGVKRAVAGQRSKASDEVR